MVVLNTLLATVLPVFLLTGLGWVVRRQLQIEVRDPAKLCLYVLMPGLTLNAILNTRLEAGEIGKIIGFTVLLTIVMIAITLVIGKALGYSLSERNASVLTSAFMNAGNYGLPVAMLAFGQAGFDRAAVFMIVENIFLSTLAVFFAAHGRLKLTDALRTAAKQPALWAALAASALRLAGVTLPAFLSTPISMLANGALVVIILVLGMQVASVTVRGARSKIGFATVLRLIVSPLAGMALVWFLRPEPLTAKVLILQSAMPAAVTTSLLAMEYGTEPDLVSSATLVSTCLSMVTVTSWIFFLH
ncbi:MAG TPA: AEC family transporter [Symbiobacteriaceae bacterium]|nr:AEC family transporter [Symbiobacteriaceae bacterium]